MSESPVAPRWVYAMTAAVVGVVFGDDRELFTGRTYDSFQWEPSLTSRTVALRPHFCSAAAAVRRSSNRRFRQIGGVADSVEKKIGYQVPAGGSALANARVVSRVAVMRSGRRNVIGDDRLRRRGRRSAAVVVGCGEQTMRRRVDNRRRTGSHVLAGTEAGERR